MHEDYMGEKLCIFISKNDKYEGIVLYELLLEIAFNSRLTGGTVTIGHKGFFGAQDESSKLKILRSSENLPVVLEFQGKTNRINRYIQRIQPMIKEGLLTRTDVRITKFNATDEEAEAFEVQENADQSQIFKEDVDVTNIRDPQPPSQDFSTIENEDDTVRTEFLEPDQDQTTEEVVIEIPKAPVDIPSFEDDNVSDSAHELGADKEKMPDDELDETSDPPTEDDSWIEEEPEEATPVMQLTDRSEAQTGDRIEDSLEMDNPTNAEDVTFKEAESAENNTEEDLDELFDESNEKFESTFDDMLKQAGKASGADSDLDSQDEKSEHKEKEKAEIPGDEAGESAEANSKAYDKNHSEEHMKSYFSKLFKSD